jgi:hypothetical protein
MLLFEGPASHAELTAVTFSGCSVVVVDGAEVTCTDCQSKETNVAFMCSEAQLIMHNVDVHGGRCGVCCVNKGGLNMHSGTFDACAESAMIIDCEARADVEDAKIRSGGLGAPDHMGPVTQLHGMMCMVGARQRLSHSICLLLSLVVRAESEIQNARLAEHRLVCCRSCGLRSRHHF